MRLRSVLRGGLILLFLGVGFAQPAQAQLKWRLHGGIAEPFGATSDYFNLGWSGNLDVALPMSDRLDLVLDVGMDVLATSDIYPTPGMNLWRYRAELETDLVGGDDQTFVVRALAGAGATTIVSRKFWLVSRQPYTYDGERLNSTALAATGGLRIGMKTPDDLTWWLSGKLNWSRLNEPNQDALRELSRNELDKLGAAMSFTLTLGVGL